MAHMPSLSGSILVAQAAHNWFQKSTCVKCISNMHKTDAENGEVIAIYRL